MAEQIVVELVVDDSQLQPALDQLEKTGQVDAKMANGFKATNAEINKQANVLKLTSAEFKKTGLSLEQLIAKMKEGSKATQDNDKVLKQSQEELKSLRKEFEELSKKFDELKNKQKESGDQSDSLRQKLKLLKERIAELKLANQDNTEEFRNMVVEAGKIEDALGDAASEIRNFASDSRTLDNVLGSIQAVAGGFAVAQGTVALFGDENEELQKVLLKVNALMAVLQGLQSVSNALQKEGAIAQLLSNKQWIITNAQLAIENGLQSQSVVVRLAAAGAQRVLNAAMAANPIGILVVAVAGLIAILGTYGRSAAEATHQTNTLNAELSAGSKGFDERTAAIQQLGETTVNALENEGAVASKINKAQLDNQDLLINAIKERQDRLLQLQQTTQEADLDKRQELADEIGKIQDQLLSAQLKKNDLADKLTKKQREEQLKDVIAISEKQLQQAEEGGDAQLQLQKKLINQRAALELNADGLLQSQRAAIIAKAEQERHELQSAFDKRRIDLQLKNIDTQLVNVREGSKEEFNLKIQQLRLLSQAELTSIKLSTAEKKTIKEKELQDELKLQREFNERIRAEAIQGQIDLNSAELSNIKTNAEDRLLLTISNLELAAQLEVDAAKGNANKIAAINAKRDADIKAARKSFIEEQLQEEIDLASAREGANNRALQRISADEKQSVLARIAAVQQLAETDIATIQKREDALEEERQSRLIGEQEYNKRYAQLQDEKAKVSEDAEKKITDLNAAENEKRRKRDQETIELVLNTAQQIVDIIGQINDIRNQKDAERIQGERNRIEELREAGAISEKEAILRNKRLDNEEKKVKREAAQRDKQLAIFNAVINTAQAVTKALASAPPPFNAILAGIAAALGAAQIAVIASRPLPKFRKGKKDSYQGPGIIGEAGPELFEHEGKLYMAKKETLVWLGKEDKVYTPTETKQMLPEVDRKVMSYKPETQKSKDIDYDQLGKAVGKHVRIPGITIDEEGFKVWQDEGMSRKNYMDKYYRSK